MQKRFLQAAENGDLVGAFNVGVCYAEGVGTERDEARAAYWMQRAADGVVNAQYWLGRMYLEGRGLKEDIGLAMDWLGKAAGARMTEAMILLAQILVSGRRPEGRITPVRSFCIAMPLLSGVSKPCSLPVQCWGAAMTLQLTGTRRSAASVRLQNAVMLWGS